MKIQHLLFAALLVGCGSPDAPTLRYEALEVDPIPRLPSYRNGTIFHPFRFDLDDAERYPLPSPGKASDPLCWLGDSYFVECIVYECDAARACPTGWSCRDVRFSFDPPQDHDVDPGYLLYRWPAYHLAACVKP